jgi:seryl-tRNA synthetase
VSSLVSKLQLYVQQVNSALEDTSQQVLQNMPRIIKDAQNLQQESLELRKDMTEMQNQISQVQKETGACMYNLERLDSLKSKLQTAKQGLQESDGWGRLTSELDDLLEKNDQQQACEKLFALQRSLAAQTQ